MLSVDIRGGGRFDGGGVEEIEGVRGGVGGNMRVLCTLGVAECREGPGEGE